MDGHLDWEETSQSVLGEGIGSSGWRAWNSIKTHRIVLKKNYLSAREAQEESGRLGRRACQLDGGTVFPEMVRSI